jgi:hypothetical protein
MNRTAWRRGLPSWWTVILGSCHPGGLRLCRTPPLFPYLGLMLIMTVSMT